MLPQFLNYNNKCPLCNKPLTLYMRWIDSLTFRGQELSDNTYKFTPSNLTEQQNHFSSESMTLEVDQGIKTLFSSNELFAEAKKHQIYFFYLCNPEGLKEKSWGEFEISIYKACYYRSTAFFEFKKEEPSEDWSLQLTDSSNVELQNKDETFAIHTHANELEKVYVMNLDYQNQVSMIWHYSVSDKDKEKPGFRPNVFEKSLPLLKNRPNLEPDGREKLIDRFDSWILMS